ncbi:MAG: hypothetical protein E6K44_12995 [Gammaproteobacteria bacterium]|nr:MAG: hypothetical protein E6K44_12995 [Gammaproteobacteria bacterium]
MRRTLCLLLGLLGAAAPGQAAGFNFASLQSLLSRQDIDSVEELIAALPAAQRSRYALVFESRSLQGASLENPRVILYGTDAHFIVTFNGSPAQRGFRVVETMEFDDDSKEFRLRELVFPERAAGVDKVVVSEVNPQQCARCHGAPARPVWDTFPLWPGAYGERYRARLSARERTGLAAFLALQPTHPRYGQLLGVKRFADPQTFRSSALTQYAGIPEEPPNAELAIDLGRLQAQSIARQLVRQPGFELYRYALLGVADNACGRLADFYPDALWRTQRPGFERFARDSAASNARQARLLDLFRRRSLLQLPEATQPRGADAVERRGKRRDRAGPDIATGGRGARPDGCSRQRAGRRDPCASGGAAVVHQLSRNRGCAAAAVLRRDPARAAAARSTLGARGFDRRDPLPAVVGGRPTPDAAGIESFGCRAREPRELLRGAGRRCQLRSAPFAAGSA